MDCDRACPARKREEGFLKVVRSPPNLTREKTNRAVEEGAPDETEEDTSSSSVSRCVCSRQFARHAGRVFQERRKRASQCPPSPHCMWFATAPRAGLWPPGLLSCFRASSLSIRTRDRESLRLLRNQPSFSRARNRGFRPRHARV
ncbi:hypothetical protein MRX96_028124 [Rhipicephalus microplus]